MSVWVTAMFSHGWHSFSKSLMEEIARTVSTESNGPKWLQHPQLKSPEEQFAAEGTVFFFLPGDFTVGFGKRTLNLQHTDRWSTFLVDETVRHQFLSACNNVARLAAAREILLLPEGTVLMDQFYGGADFEEVKRVANQKWGSPDLDIRHIYRASEVQRMAGERVHYFLVNAVDL
jgi:hypothetical protein